MKIMSQELSFADLEKGGWDFLPTTIWDYFLEVWNKPTGSFSSEEHWKWLNSLPRGIRFTFLWTHFDGDILNGGIPQFFDNHCPMVIYSTLQMLKETSLHESANVLEKAMRIFHEKHDFPLEPDDQKFDRHFLQAYDDSDLEELDKLRCNSGSSNRDYVRLNQYLLRHINECVYSPSQPEPHLDQNCSSNSVSPIMTENALTPISPITWISEDFGYLRLLDQTRLPGEIKFLECRRSDQVWEAIRSLRVRGAPAIGVAAAYGVVLGCRFGANHDREHFDKRLEETLKELATSRPTAVNLFWALDRMRKVAANNSQLSPLEMLQRLLQEARAIETEDREMCAAIGRHGAELLKNCTGVLTHCNTGGLATAGDGTALAAIFAAAKINPQLQIYADETRPLLQGARLTAWELMQRNVNVTLICDSMAAWVMKEKKVQAVIVGADRIAANGDAANKIGTYGLSVLAKAHGIPFYVAAPSSTFDLTIPNGDAIPIEQRAAAEITHGFGKQTAPTDCPVYNPAFDVAPAANIAALITERGVIQPVNENRIRHSLAHIGG